MPPVVIVEATGKKGWSMAGATLTNWKQRLEQAALKAKAKVVGWQKIREVQHGLLIATPLDAFGDDPRASFFIEVRNTTGDIPRPDLILLHPEVGVLVVENKGISVTDINGVDGTALKLVRDGRFKEEDPFHQAERVSFRLRDLAALRADLMDMLFLQTAALPRITRQEFECRFQTRWPDEALFAETCADPQKFKAHILGFSDYTQRKAKRSCKLSKRAHDAVMTVLSGKSFIYAPRKSYIEETDPSLIGVQIQEMELALKDATHQQKELGRADLRGNHRLFRGVAGSGKSIMCALSVAQTLTKFRDEHASLFAASAPKQRVLVTCFNKTLVHYLRQRIEDRFGRLVWDRPTEEELVVRHFEGLVRDLAVEVPALKSELNFRQKEKRAKELCDVFDKLDAQTRERVLFDAVYVDEAQDLVPEEFELLLRLARKDAKGNQTFILFYDNAQNIYGVPSPVWTKLGINIVGRTVFLDQCLRNTRETLLFAFNVLVGSFAPEGQRVTTRQFADVESLRERGLIEEQQDRFDIRFSPRTGPTPFVRAYRTRDAEVDGVVEAVRRLIINNRVIPSDILILFNSHHSYSDTLGPKLEKVVGSGHRVRFVDSAHNANKEFPLIEDGVLTVSTVASSKGYDAPVVFLLGVDELSTSTQDRATFYVGATRAKLHLVVTGVQKSEASLFGEVLLAAKAIASASASAPVAPSLKPEAAPKAGPAVVQPTSSTTTATKRCRHCGSQRLHAQHGKFGYFFRCIECTENTPMEMACSRCGKRAKIRKAGNQFLRECECGHSELYHENVPLGALFE